MAKSTVNITDLTQNAQNANNASATPEVTYRDALYRGEKVETIAAPATTDMEIGIIETNG